MRTARAKLEIPMRSAVLAAFAALALSTTVRAGPSDSSATDAPRRIAVAAAQTVSQPGDISGNLARAEDAIADAARRGADLVLLPELMLTGYVVSTDVWHDAEPIDGPAVHGLAELAHRHGVFVGTTVLESDKGEVYNTFVLIGPDGSVRGHARKQYLAGHERYIVAPGDDGARVIDTELGRIGIAVCFEATIRAVLRDLAAADVDLILLPHADPVPEAAADDAPAAWDHDLRDTARQFAVTLGVPAVLANQAGQWSSPMPGLLPDQRSYFRGQSAVVTGDGAIVASLDQRPGVIVAEVPLTDGQPTGNVPRHGRYCKPMPFLARAYQVALESLGALSYRISSKRRRAILAAEKSS